MKFMNFFIRRINPRIFDGRVSAFLFRKFLAIIRTPGGQRGPNTFAVAIRILSRGSAFSGKVQDT